MQPHVKSLHEAILNKETCVEFVLFKKSSQTTSTWRRELLQNKQQWGITSKWFQKLKTAEQYTITQHNFESSKQSNWIVNLG